MIKSDQPTIFGKDIIVAVSSISDGNIKFGVGETEHVTKNRRDFLQKVGIDIAKATLVGITYDTDDFAKYRIVTHVDKGVGMAEGVPIEYADALVVDHPDHALFLPIADCVGVVIHDPARHVLMVSHIGRHSTEIDGGAKSIHYLKTHFGTDPKDVLIWLSPAVGSNTYPLRKFEGKSLHEAIIAQLLKVKVLREHIEASSVDTASDSNYFSHSQYLKDPTNEPGRFAVVAMMHEQGEPAS